MGPSLIPHLRHDPWGTLNNVKNNDQMGLQPHLEVPRDNRCPPVFILLPQTCTATAPLLLCVLEGEFSLFPVLEMVIIFLVILSSWEPNASVLVILR